MYGETVATNGMVKRDIEGITPIGRVKLANNMAQYYSADAKMRRIAALITRTNGNVPRQAPAMIARWIRKNLVYAQETPGVEILQGPYHSLKYKVVDCDDAALLWVTLTRALGLDTYFAGAGMNDQPGVLYHAVGYDAGTGKHYELSVDRRYLGPRPNGIDFTGPEGSFTVIYKPEGGAASDPDGAFWVSPIPGAPYQPTSQQALESGAYLQEKPMFMGYTPAPKPPFTAPVPEETTAFERIAEEGGMSLAGSLGDIVTGLLGGGGDTDRPDPSLTVYDQARTAPPPAVAPSTGPSPLLILGLLGAAGVGIWLIARR